ncbi:unnamed protein product [Cuscuta epithymum]|uniref:Uncharacterized protein n=1 Tax=Cuscuta epithymum TaxID=186058 RepID=A0AAV0E4V2_9ASTE|nr:unnamed protein product [Cuscuta epithymum]
MMMMWQSRYLFLNFPFFSSLFLFSSPLLSLLSLFLLPFSSARHFSSYLSDPHFLHTFSSAGHFFSLTLLLYSSIDSTLLLSPEGFNGLEVGAKGVLQEFKSSPLIMFDDGGGRRTSAVVSTDLGHLLELIPVTNVQRHQRRSCRAPPP